MFPIIRKRMYSVTVGPQLINRIDIIILGVCVFRRESEFRSTHLKAPQ